MKGKNIGNKSDKEWARDVFRDIRNLCNKHWGVELTPTQKDDLLVKIGMKACVGLGWLNLRKKGCAA